MAEPFDAIVIGAGQAGLCTSYYLSKLGVRHLVLEQADQLIPAWRGRWDSFTLVTPNWTIKLPEGGYLGNEPDGFLTREEVVEMLERFAGSFDPPVQFGVRVNAVESASVGSGYRVQTSKEALAADNVVAATGMFQNPRIPPAADRLSGTIHQLHTSMYRNPSALPEGGVLVVGTGQSGCQIAEELHESGRQVYLCVGKTGRAPRRYRGLDTVVWLERMGFNDMTADQLESPADRFRSNPHVSGKKGGRTLNLHQFARDGMTLLGRLEDIDGNTIHLADDLKESLAAVDRFATDITQAIDEYIEKGGIDAPVAPIAPPLQDGYQAEAIAELDLADEGVSSVIWATGYQFDFSWVNFPVFDRYGFPVQKQGVTDQAGLYFVGLPFLHKAKSGLLAGVAADAAHVANHIAARN